MSLWMFLQGPRYIRYWIVGDRDGSGSGSSASAGGGDTAGYGGFAAVLAQYSEREREEQDRLWRTAQAGGGGIDKNSPFVKHIGWSEHFWGRDLARLMELGALPPANPRAAHGARQLRAGDSTLRGAARARAARDDAVGQ